MATQTQFNLKSGIGIRDGVVSELAAFFRVKPGHEEELRAALARFAEVIRTTDPERTQKTGLRDTRHVIFDNGTRLLWVTTFETDWDPYLDDALVIVGVAPFADWLKHVVEAEQFVGWLTQAGGAERLMGASGAELEQIVKQSGGGLKSLIRAAQTPAAGYWNALADQTIPEIRKARRVNQAFQQVLDDPAAGAALQHPAMKPLVEEAVD